MPGCLPAIKLYQIRDGVPFSSVASFTAINVPFMVFPIIYTGSALANSRVAVARAPGAEVTHYNNSYGFMSWVVYTLCEPPDNHQPRTIRVLIPTFASRCLRRAGTEPYNIAHSTLRFEVSRFKGSQRE